MRVLPPFSFDGEPAALLYLINLTAGLMDGDSHLMEIVARPGARAVVTGQSASRIHPALLGFARQQWALNVQEDACLVVLPGPAIPFQGTRFYQRGRAHLASTARLIWTDDDVRWYWGGHLACSSLFATGEASEVKSASGETFRRSVFPLDSGDTCIRWCGEPNAVTADLVQTSLQLAAVAPVGPACRRGC